IVARGNDLDPPQPDHQYSEARGHSQPHPAEVGIVLIELAKNKHYAEWSIGVMERWSDEAGIWSDGVLGWWSIGKWNRGMILDVLNTCNGFKLPCGRFLPVTP